MGRVSRKDFISDLPQSIIETILTKVPIRDAVRTSILSRKWRYQWATMTQLVLDKECVYLSEGRKVSEKELVNFIIRFFLLHDGPIHKFKLSTEYSISSTDMDTWLLFLSRKDIKELLLGVWQCKDHEFFRTPSYIFSCQKLTRLKLYEFEVKPSFEFQGFPCLKCLNVYLCKVTLEVIENLISGCPMLEKFKFTNDDDLALTVRSPNLRHLTVNGMFKDVYLEHTPLLVDLNLDFISKDWEDNVLVKVPVTYDCLKIISLGQINFEEMNQVSYVLHLLLQSPNLQELNIVAGDIKRVHQKAADLDFWERECPTDFTFKHLKIVLMSYLSNKNDIEFLKFVLGRSPVLEVMNVHMSCLPNKNDIEFLKFVLGRSPVLEVMNITLESFDCGKLNMSDDELLRLQQASPKIKLHLIG